jgi:hypothetical protein
VVDSLHAPVNLERPCRLPGSLQQPGEYGTVHEQVTSLHGCITFKRFCGATAVGLYMLAIVIGAIRQCTCDGTAGNGR